MQSNGVLLVISGPSGVGKGTISKKILKRNENLSLSISATTRKPRCEDVEGCTYFFKSTDEFKRMIDEDMFLEWAMYNGNYYGTPAKPVEESLKSGRDILLEIDVQGALDVKEKFPEGIYIFIAPPSRDALFQRLLKRGTESGDEIKRRLGEAERELSLKDRYDYVVINDNLDDAIIEIETIIENEKAKRLKRGEM